MSVVQQIRCKSFARKVLRCGVVAFADEGSNLSLQNYTIGVGSPANRAGFSLATDAQSGDRRVYEVFHNACATTAPRLKAESKITPMTL